MAPPGISHFRGDITSSTRLRRRKQRVLLARALYGEPKVLFLDEGTAHLDPRTEAAVSAALAGLGITKLIIAHRPDAVRGAVRVAVVSGGHVTEPVAPVGLDRVQQPPGSENDFTTS